jgi:hypothetical protein
MASVAHRSKRRRRTSDGFRQAIAVIAIGAAIAAGLFAAGGYVITGQHGPATVQAFIKAATDLIGAKVATAANDDEIYTGSILYIPYQGTNCRQLLFDNRNGRFTDNGNVDCIRAAYQSGIGSPKQWSAARVKVISTGFRDR